MLRTIFAVSAVVFSMGACRADFDADDGDGSEGADGPGDADSSADTGYDDPSDCDDDHFDYAFEVAGAGNCYAISMDAVPWATAEAACIGWGGHLAGLTTSEENAGVAAALLDAAEVLDVYLPWIGASYSDPDWTWTTDETFEFTAWGADQPNDFVEGTACVSMHGPDGWRWHDQPCDVTHNYICERPLGGG